MKVILFFISFFVLLPAFQAHGSSDQIPLLQNVYGRKNQVLNGYWHRIIDPLESGFYDYRKKENSGGFFTEQQVDNRKQFKEYDFRTSPYLLVPGDWNTQERELFYYESTVWYQRTFRVDDWKLGNEYYLYFGAANYEAIVYVNGKKAGQHTGGYTPFNFNVSSLLKKGENSVVVKVDNRRKSEGVPTDNFDWWNYGGLTRDVMLVEVPELFIYDYHLGLKKGRTDQLQLKLTLSRQVPGVSVKLKIPGLKIDKELITNQEGEVLVEIKAKPALWSDESPVLYTVTLTSGRDSISDEIGFRTISTRGKELLLNGKPIFLRGICIHEEAPYRAARAYSKDDARTLLGWAKDLGCNFVRLAHYPHNEHMIREAEKMGMLVWSEIPVYWTVDFRNSATLDNAKNQLEEMISRDRNRVNIIVWSIANETPHSSDRDRFLASLAKHARRQDDSRLISMAMERGQYDSKRQYVKDSMNRYVDVISFNQYIGWYDGTWEKCDQAEWEIPYDKPVIVSEFGAGALYGLRGESNERWTEDYQAELYRRTLSMIDRIDGVVGVTPWIMVDFRSSKRLLPGVQDGFNRKGVYTINGEKKKAFYVLRDWFRGKQQKF